jgi:chromosomal replication initiation ATPase DnaA
VSRARAHVAFARQIGMYVTHVVCGLTLTEVGRGFACDRTTVAHACGVVEDQRGDPHFDHSIERVEQIARALLEPRPGLHPHGA